MDSDLLDDLEELGAEEELGFEDVEGGEEDIDDQDNTQGEEGEQGLLHAMLNRSTGKAATIHDLTKTFRSSQLKQIEEKIDGFMSKERSKYYNSGPAESDPEYQTIVEANTITVELIHEITLMTKVSLISESNLTA